MTAVWDVAIVGCGPVGAYAANLLGRAGLSTIVLERDTAPYALPRAVHIDHEMMRLLADVDALAPLEDLLFAANGHLHIGADHGMIRYLSAAGQPRPYGYANDYFFYQPELEEVLRNSLNRFDNVALRLGVEVEDVSQTADAVTLRLSDGSDLRCRWAIGTDGARSTVRKALGVQLDDLGFEEPWLVVDAEVDGPLSFPDLTGVPDGADLHRLSVMMCDPARPATIVPGRGNHRRWEFMLLPGERDAEMSRPEVVADLLAPWVGKTPHTVIRAATYRFHGLIAKDWRKGRVFLAGDAAHQTPPFFGQGMCHGMRDVANLAWKLQLVVQDGASDRLLDTYQQERDAQVRHVIGKAIEAGKYICILDPAKAAERDERVRSQTDIRTAAELIAPIASGIVSPGTGERFVNPAVDADAKLLDNVTGGGWVLLHGEEIALSPDADAVLHRLGARRFRIGTDLADPEGQLRQWLDDRDASAVLIRPDFYTATVAADGPELSERIVAMAGEMALVPAATET